MACRTGCESKDHATYAACCRSVRVGDLTGTQKPWSQELAAYESARRQGVQPAGTTMAKVRDALEKSDASGVAYDAGA